MSCCNDSFHFLKKSPISLRAKYLCIKFINFSFKSNFILVGSWTNTPNQTRDLVEYLSSAYWILMHLFIIHPFMSRQETKTMFISFRIWALPNKALVTYSFTQILGTNCFSTGHWESIHVSTFPLFEGCGLTGNMIAMQL